MCILSLLETNGVKIMIYLKDIMKLLNCDIKIAEKVFDNMELDFSQSTTSQFNKEATRVYMLLAFGSDFMASADKGTLKEYS
jgi:hypothetical protein